VTIYPLTSVQQAVWLDQLLTPSTPCYNVGALWRIERDIDIALLNKAIKETLIQHDALKLTLKESQTGVIQTIVSNKDVILEYHDFSLDKDANQKARDYLKEKFNHPFNLYEELLWRCVFIKINPTTSYWLINSHHIIADGTSVSLLSGMIMDRYKELKSGNIYPVPEIFNYRDFIANDCAYLQSTRYERDRAFWLDRFAHTRPAGLERRPGFEADRAWPSHQINRHLPAERYQQLCTLAAQHDCSPMHLMIALLACWYSRLWQVEQVVVGVPVHNRSGAQHKRTLGMFSSMIPVQLNVDVNQPFSALMVQIAAELRCCYRHQRFPIAELNRHLRLSQQGRRQLYDLSFSLETFLTDIELEGNQLKVEALHHGFEQMPLALYLRRYHHDDPPLLEFNFNEAWFSVAEGQQTAARLMQMLDHLLDKGAQQPLTEMPLLLPQEKKQIVSEWNNTRQPWPLPEGIHRWFEQQAVRTPQASALCGHGGNISYQQLNQRANQLAAELRQAGIGPDDRVALCAARSSEMVTALLAILKAGGAYVPLDPDYPGDRLHHMLEDCGATLVLLDDAGQQALAPLLSASHRVWDLQQDAARWQTQPDHNLPSLAGWTPHSLAYVIYTSGSTGKPKGVMNEHVGVMNRLQWMQAEYALTPQDTVLQKTPFSFDVSVWEFFWPLMVGARLAIAKPGGHQDPDYLSQLIARQQVTTLHFVPSMLQLFLRHGDMAQCHCLRRVMCSGEALPLAAVQRFHQQLPQAELHNLYGPTEAAVDVSYWHCSRHDKRGVVPIGKPVANTQLHILDAHLQPLPPGVSGELHIGGVQVARGYLNLAELTAARFIPDPFSKDATARLYKTGDLARWLEDGSIEYLGRNDFQVKIHGLRIELGEIEQQIAHFNGIEEAVVMACDDGKGDKRLIAWLVAAPLPNMEEQLRQHLHAALPDYMIPSAFVRLDAFPLSPNGKLDRKALPAPIRVNEEGAWRAPQSAGERQLAEWWGELLQVEKIGCDDDFFALGGHSLHAIQLMVRLKRQGIALEMKTLFAHSTLRAQALVIAGHGEENSVAQPVLPMQKLLQQLNPSTQPFHQTQRLNTQVDAQDVWMVHPAVVGCEIYRDLALSFDGQLNAIGINNYNLFHQQHISSLSALARLYLQHMFSHGLPSHQPVRLLGWSLGGVIALEIAVQLEKLGYRDIHLCLLDSLYQTEFQQQIAAGSLAPILAMLGIEGEAADRALQIEQLELAMNNQPLSAPLCHSRVTLFKAIEFADLSLDGVDGAKVLAIKDNGLSDVCPHLEVIPLPANHHSIILCHDPIGAMLTQGTKVNSSAA